MNNQLSEIEVKLAYQERLIDELNQIVTDLNQKVYKQERQIRLLFEELEEAKLSQQTANPASHHEKPPHY